MCVWVTGSERGGRNAASRVLGATTLRDREVELSYKPREPLGVRGSRHRGWHTCPLASAGSPGATLSAESAGVLVTGPSRTCRRPRSRPLAVARQAGPGTEEAGWPRAHTCSLETQPELALGLVQTHWPACTAGGHTALLHTCFSLLCQLTRPGGNAAPAASGPFPGSNISDYGKPGSLGHWQLLGRRGWGGWGEEYTVWSIFSARR